MEWFRIIGDLFVGIAWPVALVVCLLIFNPSSPIFSILFYNILIFHVVTFNHQLPMALQIFILYQQ